MLYFDPPRIRHSLAQAALREPYPCWLMDPHGVVCSANLMALWLWGGLQQTKQGGLPLLLGHTIFDIQAVNLERIPFPRNLEFYAKQSTLVKHLAETQSSFPYALFIAAMKAEPQRAAFYEDASANSERLWEYGLVIRATQSEVLLDLHITIYRLEGDAGFLVLTSPSPSSLAAFEEQYRSVMTHFGEGAYIVSEGQQGALKQTTWLSTLMPSFRSYYPMLVQDPLWYLVEENRAHQLLIGGSALGMHFFELFFAPQLREWLGPLQETSAPRALRYFETFTAPLRREDHEFHAAYLHVLQRLSQLPDYHKIQDLSWKSIIHLNLPENPDLPFYTCRVFLPWALDPQVTLHLSSTRNFER